ncbi:hypothetical protein BDP27DRAFT_1366595 [Rhodocollybia butyracea]|uniref:Uncharacterized protein n=1 Tax=Rhodocollybia butyracea TaxID=206335 RepID=A0A9P5PJW0_9AGAR|nr:hypothetical protein BDP27DRAFT_1366595 [Rhodocollybia butyracea]
MYYDRTNLKLTLSTRVRHTYTTNQTIYVLGRLGYALCTNISTHAADFPTSQDNHRRRNSLVISFTPYLWPPSLPRRLGGGVQHIGLARGSRTNRYAYRGKHLVKKLCVVATDVGGEVDAPRKEGRERGRRQGNRFWLNFGIDAVGLLVFAAGFTLVTYSLSHSELPQHGPLRSVYHEYTVSKDIPQEPANLFTTFIASSVYRDWDRMDLKFSCIRRRRRPLHILGTHHNTCWLHSARLLINKVLACKISSGRELRNGAIVAANLVQKMVQKLGTQFFELNTMRMSHLRNDKRVVWTISVWTISAMPVPSAKF